MSGQEVLTELTGLARGNSKDKLRALALLSQHHGLLDGKQAMKDEPVEMVVKYINDWRQDVKVRLVDEAYKELDRWKTDVEKDINELNDKGLQIYEKAKAKFADKPDVGEFCKYYEQLLGAKPSEAAETDDNIMLPAEKPVEPQIIPPERRLEPAPA